MPSRHFHHPVGKFTQWRRKLADDLMRRLGRPLHVVHAHGARILVDSTDFIDKFIAWEGIWDGPQLMRLDALCESRRIDCFVDVGANTGFYSVMFAAKKLTQRIIAFEPDPDNLARLMTNLALNNLAGRVEVHALALGDAAGEVTLYQGANSNRGESTIAVPEQTPQAVTFQVRQIRFDDAFSLVGQSLIIKVDVEGYEFEALAGMTRTLRDNACYLQIELYSDRLEELKAWFAAQGYRYLDTEGIDYYFTNMPDVS
jgi:FkbM family methyltransferase